MAKRPLRNGLIRVTTDGICSTSGTQGGVCLW